MIRTTNGRNKSDRSIEVHEVTRAVDDDTVDIGLSTHHAVVESIDPAPAFAAEPVARFGSDTAHDQWAPQHFRTHCPARSGWT
ncbi:hypothetical protein [Rhodococcoides fascians]|uniref:hypothetical protein n=1 Tax=Rhodococcoides fascians TaxID=1828 RepID=UPI00050C5A18|nr:hypothetical protein [Rhodococcus fascians]